MRDTIVRSGDESGPILGILVGLSSLRSARFLLLISSMMAAPRVVR